MFPSTASHVTSRVIYHLLGFLFPTIVLLYTHSCILRCSESERTSLKKKFELFIRILLIVFYVSWIPYNVALLVDTIRGSSNDSTSGCVKVVWTVVKVTAIVGCLHSCFNPLIYFSFSETFRHFVLTTFRCGGCSVTSEYLFPWDSKETNKDTVQKEEKSLSICLTDATQTVTRQQIDDGI